MDNGPLSRSCDFAIGFFSAVEVFTVVSTQISGTFTQKQLRPYSDRLLFYLMGT